MDRRVTVDPETIRELRSLHAETRNVRAETVSVNTLVATALALAPPETVDFAIMEYQRELMESLFGRALVDTNEIFPKPKEYVNWQKEGF